MNQSIVITPADLMQAILYICGAIVTISAASVAITNMIQKMRRPNAIQDERIDAIENKLKIHDLCLSNDKEQLKDLKLATKVQIKATQALLSHSIDGDALDEMVSAKQAISNYIDGKIML